MVYKVYKVTVLVFINLEAIQEYQIYGIEWFKDKLNIFKEMIMLQRKAFGCN